MSEDKDALIYLADMRIDQLEAENAKLQDQLEEQKCFAADLERDVRALRELVRDMADYGEGAGSGMAEWFVDRMRELGVEQ